MALKHTVRISKEADRNLNPASNLKQLEALLAGVNTSFRVSKGWRIGFARKVGTPWTQEMGSGAKAYVYHVVLDVTCDKNRPDDEFQDIVNAVDRRGKNQPGAGPNRWRVTLVEGKPYTPVLRFGDGNTDEVAYHELAIPKNFPSYFRSLYGLEPHINIIHQAVQAAIRSNWRHRFHCALIGPPGCGKSHVCDCLKEAFGADAVLEFDATSTTTAGAQKELTERPILPRILLVEEIEKAPEAALSWLLSVLDLRAGITKTTYRSRIVSDTRLLCIATVNDLPTFKKVAFGALHSRFANEINFNRPTPELLKRILAREIDEVGGNHAWIEPTLKYCESKKPEPITDPRKVIAIALGGREQLLRGKYQKDLEATSAA